MASADVSLSGSRSSARFKNTALKLAAIRLAIAWPMIVVFALGSIALWVGSITSLIKTGGFAGITSWQILGIFLLVYVGRRTYNRATAWDDVNKCYVAPLKMRRRLWAILAIIVASAAANLVAILYIIENLRTGRLEWALQDTAAFVVAGLMTVVLVAWKRRRVLESEASIFFLALATRVIPQVGLSFSPDLRSIPWLALGGVGAIAAQRFFVSSIELAEAKSNHAAGAVSKDSLTIARWIWRGDLGNLAAIVVPIGAKLFV